MSRGTGSLEHALLACGHSDKRYTPTGENAGTIWRMIRRPLPSTSSAPEQNCRQCKEGQESKTNNPKIPNPLRRCAPPTRGVNPTLMAVLLGEDETSISALKNVQQQSQRAAKATSTDQIAAPSEEQQLENLQHTLDDMEKFDVLWKHIHESHSSRIRFLPYSKPYSSFAGPYRCPLCKVCRHALVDPKFRQDTDMRDHDERDGLIVDESQGRFKLFMEPGGAKNVPPSVATPSTWALSEEDWAHKTNSVESKENAWMQIEASLRPNIDAWLTGVGKTSVLKSEAVDSAEG